MSKAYWDSATAHADPRLEEQWDRLMHKEFGARRLKHANLTEAVDTMAARGGLDAPRLYISSAFAPIFGGSAPNACALPQPVRKHGSTIVMTESLLNLFEHSPSKSEISPELLSIIGHEMGHLKQGYRYIDAVRKYPAIVGPVAGVAALYLLDQATKKVPARLEGYGPTPQALAAALHREADAEKAARGLTDAHPLREHDSGKAIAAQAGALQSGIIEGARYVGAAAMGYVGGLGVTRQLMLELEFDADRCGAMLVGNADVAISALKKLHQAHRSMPKEERARLEGQIGIREIIEGLTEHAHPALSERIERLNALGAKMAKNVGRAMNDAFSHLHVSHL